MSDSLKQHKQHIRSYLDGTISEADLAWLDSELKANDAARELFLREANLVAGLEDLALSAGLPSIPKPTADASISSQSTDRLGVFAMVSGWALAIAALLLVWFNPFAPEQAAQVNPIATITELSGPFQWTGDGGEVRSDLALGMNLSGGTIDGLSPDSRFAMQFNDGTELLLTGDSTLVFSDNGQKILHLKSGSLAADVAPQPKGQPMLVFSRSAMMEVVGTSFEVDADVSSTALKVTEGEVRVERLSDGQSVSVPAAHRVLAAADRELSVENAPPVVFQWSSQLEAGPDDASGRWVYGRWSKSGQDGLLNTIPFITEDRKTIFASAFQVSKADSEVVTTTDHSLVRVRGQVDGVHPVFIGLTLRTADGEFGGRYQYILPTEFISERKSSNEEPISFEAEIPLKDFQLDPTLEPMRSKLPAETAHLVVESAWSHSLFSAVGLAIAEFEIGDEVSSE